MASFIKLIKSSTFFSDSRLRLVLLLLALCLRIPLLSGSFWLDEAAQALESVRPLSQQLAIRDDFQPPLLHLLVHVATYFDTSEWWLRLIGALIPGLITIFCSYKVAKIIGGSKLATFSTLLLVTSSFHIFYSQELRQYSLPAACAAASWLLLVKARKTNGIVAIRELILFGSVSTLGLYSSYLYPFLFLSQMFWLVLEYRKHLVPWLLSATGSVLLFLPWVPSFLGQLQAGTELQLQLPGWGRVVSPTQLRSLPLVLAKFMYGVLDVEWSPFFISTAVIFCLLSCIVLYSIRNNLVDLYKKSSPLLFWLVIPVVSAWIVSFWIPVLQPKRVLFSLPAFYMVVVYFVLSLQKSLGKQYLLIEASVIGLFLVINLYSIFSYWTNPQLQRENWRVAISEIQTTFPSNAVALFSFPDSFAPWRWYADPSYPTYATGTLLVQKESLQQDLKPVYPYVHVLLFEYLTDLTDPTDAISTQLLEYGYIDSGVLEYPVIGFVRIYSKPEAVISYK